MFSFKKFSKKRIALQCQFELSVLSFDRWHHSPRPMHIGHRLSKWKQIAFKTEYLCSKKEFALIRLSSIKKFALIRLPVLFHSIVLIIKSNQLYVNFIRFESGRHLITSHWWIKNDSSNRVWRPWVPAFCEDSMLILWSLIIIVLTIHESTGSLSLNLLDLIYPRSRCEIRVAWAGDQLDSLQENGIFSKSKSVPFI